MSTIDPSTVKAGDTVTLANQSPASATGVVEKITRLGTVKNPDRATHWQIDLRSPVGSFMVGPEAPYWTITDHEPPAPKWEPGTAGTATISTCETSGSTTQQHGMWFRRRGDDKPLMLMTDAGSSWVSDLVANFVPDDIETLRAEVERLATLAEGQAVKLQGAETARDVLREEMRAMRADLDASRTQVSDLTGRNGALEALVREQKQVIQARDSWIVDNTDDL